MGRKYRKKIGGRNYKNYLPEKLEQALSKVAEEGWSISKASKQYQIAYGTLYNKFKGLHGGRHGGQTVFKPFEEEAIIQAAISCGEWGFPLNMQDLQMVTKSYLDREGRNVVKFRNNMPGRDWVYSLLQRHRNNLTQRLASNIKRARAAVSKETITEYFTNLETTIANIPPANLFNYDETNMSDDPGKKRLLYKRGKKYPENVINHSKSAVSVMFCGSASGVLLPPYIIYKSEHMWDRWTENGIRGHPCCPERCCSNGSRYNRTKSGWIDAICFTDWFKTSFLPHAIRLDGKKVLIGDNLSSHFTNEVLQLCKQNNILFVCLPPNSTHLTQPLDVSFFRPLKTAWRSELLNWKMKNAKSPSLKKEEFPKLLKNALIGMNEAGKNENAVKKDLISGFEATGIFPANRNRILDKIPHDNNDENQQEQFRGNYQDSLVTFLKEKRYANTPNRGPPKKKSRLTVVPGRSVSGERSSDESQNESEEVSDSSADHSKQEMAHEEVDEEVGYEVADANITSGEFVLVRVMSGKRKSVSYRYVAIVQDVLPDGEYNLLGLKSLDATKKTFVEVENDLFTATLDDILAILPKPLLNIKHLRGPGKKHVFSKSIDVFET